MPSLIGSLYVSLTADFAPFQRNMRAADTVVGTTAANMRRNMGLTAESVTRLQRTMGTGVRPYALIAAARTFDSVQARANLLRGSIFAVTAAFGGLGAALTSNVISRYLDSFTGLENQIRVVSTGSANLAAQIGEVAAVAERSRGSLSSLATLYSRLAKAAPSVDAQTLLRRVETISKALTLGGATAQESASAAIQLSQGIASNRLGGEELRAVLETPLGLELAKGLDVSIGKFREMGYAGELTADKIFTALDKIAGSVDSKFAKAILSIDQAITIADSAVVQYAGHLDDLYGISQLVASGILGLANNLETIVPLLAISGGGLGAAFAGRLAGGFVGRRVDLVKREIKARRENLRVAKEEYAVARQSADEALKRSQAVNKITPDRAKEFADPGALKRYQRDLVAVQKADRDYLRLIEEQKQARRTLAAVSTQTTAAAVRAGDALAKQQIKVNELTDQAVRLKREEVQANTKLTAALGQQTQNTAKVRAVSDAEKEIARIRKQNVTLAGRIATEEVKLQERITTVANLRTTAEIQAARERSNALVAEDKIKRQLIRTDERRALLAQSLRNSSALSTTSGLQVIGRQRLDAASELVATERAAQRAGESLRQAGRAAGLAATGFALVRGAGASLVGFLGGPWGVAITAAILTLSYLGLRSQRTAQEIANATSIIDEELAKLNQTNAAATPKAQTALISREIEEEKKRLEVLAADMRRIQEEFATIFDEILLIENENGASPERFRDLAEGLLSIESRLQTGKLAFADIRGELEKLGVSGDALKYVESQLVKATERGDQLSQSMDEIGKRIDSLDGRRAQIELNIQVNDPYNLLTGGDPNIINRFSEADAKQREAYGFGQRALRDQIKLLELRNQLLARAGDDDKRRNTPQKIRDRAQALLEENAAIGLTREAAEKLAAEELNLEEKTRLAGQSSRSAAKDYENFANKIAELRERAAASGLSELDQEVVRFAERLKNGSKLMREYIDAINSGDLSKAPKQLLEVRDALLEIRANQAVDEIIRQYGTAAQLAGLFAEKQEILNIAVANGDITAQQAALAWADFVGQFGQYQWVDQLADAFVNFAESAVTDFENIEDAAKGLLKQIGKIILEMTLLEPLRNGLRGLFSGGFSLFGGGTDGFADLIGYGAPAGAGVGSVASGALAAASDLVGSRAIAAASNTAPVGASSGMRNVAPNIVELRMSPDVEARILQRGTQATVQIVNDSFQAYDSDVLPGRIREVASDPY